MLLFSPDTNLTALLLEAKDLEARVIILSARSVFQKLLGGFHGNLGVSYQIIGRLPCCCMVA